MDESLCIYCETGSSDEEPLSQIGLYFKENSGKNNPIDTVLGYATKLKLENMVDKINENKQQNKSTYIHNNCRITLKNQSRKRKADAESGPATLKSLTRRSQSGSFNFKAQCFYCERPCDDDDKHPDRSDIIKVGTKDTMIYVNTLALCRSRDTDDKAKAIERRLLSVSDFVAAEARYHKSCRSTFENPTKKYSSKGRPKSSAKVDAFEKSCKELEESMELFTIKEFQEKMENQFEEVYSQKQTKRELETKYKDNIQFVSRSGKSDIIMLSGVSFILTEAWYTDRRSEPADEAERVIKAAAKLIKNAIRNHHHATDFYPRISEILDTEDSPVPALLKVFVGELINNPLKQASLSQAIFAGARTRSVLPLQFGLAVAADNRLASNWLNTILSRLGFASSPDEVIRYKQNVVKHDPIQEIVCPDETEFLQFVGDNTDHDLATVDGKKTHHGLGSIAIANGKFSDKRFARSSVPRDKRENWSDVVSNEGIPIKPYHPPDKPALKKTILKPISPKNFSHCFTNLLWTCAHVFTNQCPSWSGYMSTVVTDQHFAKSYVTMLPIINLPATDMTALHSLLVFVTQQSSKLNVPTPTITFDQPLYVKAYEIVSSTNMNIFVRLGGFHQLMSFLGSIGCIMEGSGLRSALETVYAPLTVNHMFTGKAFSRAMRGHMLATAAVLTLIFEKIWLTMTDDEKTQLKEIYESPNPSLHEHDEVSLKLVEWFTKEYEELSTNSRTSALWLNYTRYFEIAKQFTKADRTNDWLLHVSTTKQMLNLFAATGHNNYAKTCRIYLDSIETLEADHPEIYEQFIAGNHTVRRTEKSWSGIPTDLAIEQILMRSLKGRGGVIGKGMTDNVLNVWTKSMHRCAEVSEAVDEITSVDKYKTKSAEVHKEMSKGRIRRDNEDFQKILTWFQSHNPFKTSDKLVCLNTGLTDERSVVTCDQADAIGAMIHKELDGKPFTDCSFKRKNQIKNLQSLYSSITVEKDEVSIDPLTLFLRLALAIERKPETEIDSYFYYELTPYPTSLFAGGKMRVSNKATLKNHLLKTVLPSTQESSGKVVADGGALLWLCNWSKNEKFRTIFQKYVAKCRFLKINIIVFDGYNKSTKDATHASRSGKSSEVVEIREDNTCPSDRTEFLNNYKNKESFINNLANILQVNGFEVILCPSDADTTIVKTALEIVGESVTVLADDTDIMILLIHHVYFKYPDCNIFLKSMRTQKDTEERFTYNINDIIASCDKVHIENILFAHAFTRCDTTSSIYRFGKTKILSKLKKSGELKNIVEQFYTRDLTPENVGKAAIQFFELLYSPTDTLQQIRRKKYEATISEDRSKIDPALLPPSPRAAFFHGLRVYHQLLVWKGLHNTDINPLRWGWQISNEDYVPITTDEAAGPPDLLKLIRCGCKVQCANNCSCWKAGLKCTSSCKECHGTTCKNLPIITPEPETDAVEYERNFMDAFIF